MRIDLAVPSGRPVMPTERPGLRSATVPAPSCSMRALSGTWTCLDPVFVATVSTRPAMLSIGPLTLVAAAGLGEGLAMAAGLGEGLATAAGLAAAAGAGLVA